jgi:hypothetical protein
MSRINEGDPTLVDEGVRPLELMLGPNMTMGKEGDVIVVPLTTVDTVRNDVPAEATRLAGIIALKSPASRNVLFKLVVVLPLSQWTCVPELKKAPVMPMVNAGLPAIKGVGV